MRCPNCNKFVSYDEPTIEPEADTNGSSVQLRVRIVLPCADCSEELKEAEFEEDIEITHECSAADVVLPDGDEQFHIIDADGEAFDRVQRTTPDGKAIKNPRYMKTYYGADITIHVRCNKCKEEFDLDAKVEEQASGFNELV